MKSNPTSKTQGKKKVNTINHHADAWAAMTGEIFKEWVQPYLICNMKPLTKAQLAKYEKERKARELKEKKRRAKKITMTVGELEDKLEEARDNYDY